MTLNKIVYEGIRVEMAKNRLDITYIVNQTGMIYSTLLRKLKGLIPMRLDEAMLIRDSCFPGQSLEYLFAELRKKKE